MKINVLEEKGLNIIEVQGRMDAITTAEFENKCKAIIASGKNNILFDLNGLEYISSAGLRGILGIIKLLKEQNGTLAFCALQPMVFEVFRVSGFSSMLSIYSSKDDAFLALS